MSNIEQTLSIIKPDAVERNLDNEIKEMFKSNGFKIVNEKKIQIEKAEAEKFYKVHETKPFYNDLCAYLSSGPIVVMILQKENAVLANRDLMGATRNITFGIANSDGEIVRNYYETQQPYSVPMKAAFTYLKGLVKINEDRENNIDAAISILNDALAIAPNFNLAKISIDALNAQKPTIQE